MCFVLLLPRQNVATCSSRNRSRKRRPEKVSKRKREFYGDLSLFCCGCEVIPAHAHTRSILHSILHTHTRPTLHSHALIILHSHTPSTLHSHAHTRLYTHTRSILHSHIISTLYSLLSTSQIKALLSEYMRLLILEKPDDPISFLQKRIKTSPFVPQGQRE